MKNEPLTDAELLDACVHVEKFLERCAEQCGRLGGEAKVIYNKMIQVSNAYFDDMQDYRDQFNDPTG